MKTLTDCFTLSNGVKIPCVGFGTWQTPDGETAVNAVRAAIAAGYRHIDGASVYGNEQSTGAALAECGVPRGDVFITGKLANGNRGYEQTKAAFAKTLKDLRTDYLDLYLIHWPNPISVRDRWEQSNADTWRAFEELYGAGKIRAIGVSNFHARHLDALEKTAKILPMVNQIRLCPGDTKDAVVETSRRRGMLLEAYSPFGGAGPTNLLKDPVINEITTKHGVKAAHVCVRWCLQMDFLPLPKSATPERIADNTKVFDFELDASDMERLTHLEGYSDPFPAPDNITW